MAVAIGETIISVGLIAVTVPSILVSLLARRLVTDSEIPFKEDLQRSFARGLSILPLGVIKRHFRQPPIDTLLNSPRFSASNNELCTRVSNSNLCNGFWICGAPRNEPHQDQDRDPDLTEENNFVLLWLHGGAYYFGHPLGCTATLLRVSEIVKSRTENLSLRIFALEYTLAPEGKFPTQQQQSLAAYRYLHSLGFRPEQIVVAGESAGGHLAISCLLGLEGRELPKPRGALLLFPWVNLENSSPSFVKNKNKDALSRRLLDRCVEAVGAKDGGDELGLVDFTQRCSVEGKKENKNKEKSWKDVLPAKTWVNVGSHDLFLHDIQSFVANAEADGADIELQVTPCMGHGWQIGLDQPTVKEYCNLGPGQEVPNGVMRGSESIAEGLLKLLV
ncbi:Alpha/Beta hydrolase protein [Aspergillus pseudoustus]|uniref:Alpha/Beta hydrolase protein n=1 Tax=Aspergillus pseudoustus TaxID=1810923 RepID=A0ABR4K0H2_9EURO